MISRKDYASHAVEAARSVMLELSHLLGEYRDDLVIVGGWVPELIISGQEPPHVGSIDIDLAINHRSLVEPRYGNILSILSTRGYIRSEKQPFIFFREVVVDGQTVVVEIDFLAGEYHGTGKPHRTQKFEDMRARKARGCDLVFEMNEDVTLEGELPNGGKDRSWIKVSSIVPFIVMKGMALADRLKEKDAWDIYFCVRNYPGGPDELCDQFRPHIDNKLVIEGLKKVDEKFQSPTHVGPKMIVDFEEIEEPEERELLQRDAYERIDYILRALGIRLSRE